MSIDFSQPAGTSIRVSPRSSEQASEVEEKDTSWGGDGFGVDDFIDLINPLQHIPIVGDIYREITGDEIATEARILTGTVLGGAVGFVTSAFSAMFEDATGDSVFGAIASVFEGDEAPTEATELAGNGYAATAMPTQLMPTQLPAAPQWASAAESLSPLDFSTIDSKTAPVSLPPELPADEAVLSLFAPDLLDAREKHQQSQSLIWAQEIASELDS